MGHKLFEKAWYNYFIKEDTDLEHLFINYGYAENDSFSSSSIELPAERHRYRVQLYHHIAEAIKMTDKAVLEVGCGCGGGAAYLTSHFRLASMKGIDHSENAIKFCSRYHAAIPNLSFVYGEAEELPFNHGSFDVVVNVESSHCYNKIDRFFSEVERVLHPDGYFLFTDFRFEADMSVLHQQLHNTNLELVQEENITPNIIRALDLDHDRKVEWIKNRVPRGILSKSYHTFIATKDSTTYEAFTNGTLHYFFIVLRKKAN